MGEAWRGEGGNRWLSTSWGVRWRAGERARVGVSIDGWRVRGGVSIDGWMSASCGVWWPASTSWGGQESFGKGARELYTATTPRPLLRASFSQLEIPLSSLMLSRLTPGTILYFTSLSHALRVPFRIYFWLRKYKAKDRKDKSLEEHLVVSILRKAQIEDCCQN